jgi:hypothetical protein
MWPPSDHAPSPSFSPRHAPFKGRLSPPPPWFPTPLPPQLDRARRSLDPPYLSSITGLQRTAATTGLVVATAITAPSVTSTTRPSPPSIWQRILLLSLSRCSRSHLRLLPSTGCRHCHRSAAAPPVSAASPLPRLHGDPTPSSPARRAHWGPSVHYPSPMHYLAGWVAASASVGQLGRNAIPGP